jgi:hypothetical protein
MSTRVTDGLEDRMVLTRKAPTFGVACCLTLLTNTRKNDAAY